MLNVEFAYSKQSTSLPNTIPGIDSWIHDHVMPVMDCIDWLQKKFITQHGDLISHEGLVWYENYGNAAMPSVDGESLWKRYEIDQITKADMQP